MNSSFCATNKTKASNNNGTTMIRDEAMNFQRSNNSEHHTGMVVTFGLHNDTNGTQM